MIKIYEKLMELSNENYNSQDIFRYCVHVKLYKINDFVKRNNNFKLKPYRVLNFRFKDNYTIKIEETNIKNASGVWKEGDCYILFFNGQNIYLLSHTNANYINQKTLNLIKGDD